VLSSEAGSKRVITPAAEDVSLARSGGAAVMTGVVRRAAQDLPWRVAAIILGGILTIAWTAAIVWLLLSLLTAVI
jgi:hypothetical protein